VVRPGGRIIYASPAVLRVLGHPAGTLEGTNVFSYAHPDDLEPVRAAAAEVMRMPRMATPIEVRVRHADGSWRHLEVMATNLVDNPAVHGLVLNARDVTDRVEAAAQLEARAYHDELTALPNRALLLDRLDEALHRAMTDAGSSVCCSSTSTASRSSTTRSGTRPATSCCAVAPHPGGHPSR
jgi:PAS domain S-box-containing protein